MSNKTALSVFISAPWACSTDYQYGKNKHIGSRYIANPIIGTPLMFKMVMCPIMKKHQRKHFLQPMLNLFETNGQYLLGHMLYISKYHFSHHVI